MIIVGGQLIISSCVWSVFVRSWKNADLGIEVIWLLTAIATLLQSKLWYMFS